MMEKVSGANDPLDEVKKLQDLVRKLELQNEELRTRQQNSRNSQVIDNRLISDLEFNEKNDDDFGPSSDEEIIQIGSCELSDEESWLCSPTKDDSGHQKSCDPMQWLRKEVEEAKDVELQLTKKMLVNKLDEIIRSSPDQQSPRHSRSFDLRYTQLNQALMDCKNLDTSDSPLDNIVPVVSQDKPKCIDTRTFTRPKKARAGLVPPRSYRALSGDREICDGVGLPSRQGTAVQNDGEYYVSRQSKVDYNHIQEREWARNKSVDHSGGTNLNSTYNVGDSSPVPLPLSARTAWDSGEEDRMSSASDSSSSHRLMNVGDVQTVARMQEESLRRISTPKTQYYRKGSALESIGSTGSLPSPIMSPFEDNHGYHSDNPGGYGSDHSSIDGGPPARTTSSHGNLLDGSANSSPSGSPYGSQQLHVVASSEGLRLSLPNLTHRHNAGSAQTSRPGGSMARIARPVQKPSRNAENGAPHRSQPQMTRVLPSGGSLVQPKKFSGLRPPSVSSSATRNVSPARPSTGIPRPQSRPQPQSRIPGPRQRSALPMTLSRPGSRTQPSDWMDGCY